MKTVIERELQRLQFTNDTNRVLKIELGSPNTYGEFMYILNLLAIYRVRRYAFMDDAFFVLSNPPPINQHTTQYEALLDYPVYSDAEYKPPTMWVQLGWWWDYQKLVIPIYLKHNKLLTSGFLLLILIPWAYKTWRIKTLGRLSRV